MRCSKKEKYLREKRIVLEGFGIEFSEEISNKISELYPNDADVDRYTRRIILDFLGDD